MWLKQNVGPVDRLARVVGGAALALLARHPFIRALGIFWALEGVLGYCLWYDLMNINTLLEGRQPAGEEGFPIPKEADI